MKHLAALFRRLRRRPAVHGPDAVAGRSEGAVPTGVPTEAPIAPAQSSHGKTRAAPGASSWLRRITNPALRNSSAPACLLARLENGVEVIYALHGDGRAERVQEVPVDCSLVLSATDDDLRIVAAGNLSHAAGKSLMTREAALFEALGVVSVGHVVYGTQASRIHEAHSAGRRLAPLSALADRLAVRLISRLPTVSGFVFGEQADGAIAIAVFFAQVGEGGKDRVKTFITIDPSTDPDSPDNLHAIYASYIANIGLPPESEPLVFSQSDALEGLRGFYATYPVQGDFMGVPARLAWNGALAGSAVCCLAAAGWWWVATDTLTGLEADTRVVRAHQSRDTEAITRQIEANIAAFQRFMGMAASPGLAEAEALYLPGGRVESTLTPHERIHEVFVPVRLNNGGQGDDPDSRAMTAAMSLSRQGCDRAAFEFSGAIDEIRIRFRCSGDDAAARHYRDQPGA